MILGKPKNDDEDGREVVDVRHKVEEVDKIKLSDEDLKKLEEVLLNPPAPNEALKSAAENYKKEVNDFEIGWPPA